MASEESTPRTSPPAGGAVPRSARGARRARERGARTHPKKKEKRQSRVAGNPRERGQARLFRPSDRGRTKPFGELVELAEQNFMDPVAPSPGSRFRGYLPRKILRGEIESEPIQVSTHHGVIAYADSVFEGPKSVPSSVAEIRPIARNGPRKRVKKGVFANENEGIGST